MRNYFNINSDFYCKNCGNFVSTLNPISGVINRNHCPYCLWSSHMDLFQAGDRLSACKAPMRPIGLTLKQSQKKYSRNQSGELMLIHYCEDCGAISINRIAADDFPEKICEVFEISLHQRKWLEDLLGGSGIDPLFEKDSNLINQRMYGETSLVY